MKSQPQFLRARSRQSLTSRGLLALLALLCALAGQQRLLNLGHNTTLRDNHITQKLVQLLIVADGELQVTRDDTLLLVIARSVTGQLENLSSEVFEDSGEVDGCAGTDTSGVVAVLEETVDTTDGELETGLLRARLRLAGCVAGGCLAGLARLSALARLLKVQVSACPKFWTLRRINAPFGLEVGWWWRGEVK